MLKIKQSLNAEQRKERARNAAKARWAKGNRNTGASTEETRLKALTTWANRMGYKLVPLDDADRETA